MLLPMTGDSKDEDGQHGVGPGYTSYMRSSDPVTCCGKSSPYTRKCDGANSSRGITGTGTAVYAMRDAAR